MMPLYCYTDDGSGAAKEEWFAMGKAPKSIEWGGMTRTRDIGMEQRGMSTACPEHTSMAVGCHPEQAAEYTKNAVKLGCHSTTFSDKTGEASFGKGGTGRAEKNRYLRATGYHNFDAGYSDATPK